VVTYLAPKLLWFYRFASRYLGERLRCPIRLSVGPACYEDLPARADIAFVCGLPYVELRRQHGPLFEPLAAPILQGERYAGRPVYFSDVIVRRGSPVRSFADLRGRSWAYNETHSQSGYGITRFRLAQERQTKGYFCRVVEAGYHEKAIGMVASGRVDASAIDSHLLALVCRDEPELAERLRVIDTLGPSPIQPVIASRRLSASLREELRDLLCDMSNHGSGRRALDAALIDRFDPVSDATYDPIRRMLETAEREQFLTLR
jgi:phosphonate transport system substrate-binding protein